MSSGSAAPSGARLPAQAKLTVTVSGSALGSSGKPAAMALISSSDGALERMAARAILVPGWVKSCAPPPV